MINRNEALTKERLIRLRKEKNWTQAQAAEAVGVTCGTWQQWELGTRVPSEPSLISISYVFNVNLKYVCGQTDNPTPSNLVIPESRLQPMDRNGIESYLNLTKEEKAFVRQTMDFLQSHRHQQ